MGRFDFDPFMLSELETARAKIPSFFRTTPTKKKVVRIIVLILFVCAFLVSVFYPRTNGQTIEKITDPETNEVNYLVTQIPSHIKTVFGLIIFCGILVAAYAIFSFLFERTAFREANRNALELRELSKSRFSRETFRVEEEPEPEPEPVKEEDPFAGAPYIEPQKKPIDLTSGMRAAEDPLVAQFRDKEEKKGDKPVTKGILAEAASLDTLDTPVVERRTPATIHASKQGHAPTVSRAIKRPATPSSMNGPFRKNWDQERFGNGLLDQITPEKYKNKSADEHVSDEQQAITIENMEKTIAEGPPQLNYINPYEMTKINGRIKSTSEGEVDEVDLFEPDEDIEIFKK
ncbi:MAG: hypothetical protein IKG93_00050 [Clostridiales bacterium]|nr:hypothetical protein [Clostridiales bacterium]